MKEIYLDNSMASKPSKKVISEMMPYLTEKWASPYSPHRLGERSQRGVQEALNYLYTALNAAPNDSIIVTSSGAEAVNQAIFSCYFGITMETGKNHYLASALDEAPAIMSLNRLKELSCNYKLINPTKNGFVSKEGVESALSPRTALLSLSLANGLTGVINPIDEILEVLKERSILLHLDVTHALGKIDVNVATLGAHFVTFGAEAIHAPFGCGALYIKENVKAVPFIQGGVEQAHLRGGSFSVALAMALGIACKEADEARTYLATETSRLRNLFEDLLSDELKNVLVFFQNEERLPNVTAIGFPGISAEALLYKLNEAGVYASIGGGSFQQLSLILANSAIPKAIAQSAISFSLSKEITEEDVKEAVLRVVKAVKELAPLSSELLMEGKANGI